MRDMSMALLMAPVRSVSNIIPPPPKLQGILGDFLQWDETD